MAYNYGDHNNGGLKIFAFAMIATLLFFGYVTFFMGVSIDEKDESKPTVTTEQKQAGIKAEETFDTNAVKDPWLSSAGLITHGKSVYANNCAMCHGPEGTGEGVAAKGLVPPPRDLVEGKWKYGGSQVDLFKVVTDGVKGTSMAPWGHLPDVDRWAVVHFVQSITKNKVDKPDELKEFLAAQKK